MIRCPVKNILRLSIIIGATIKKPFNLYILYSNVIPLKKNIKHQQVGIV